MSMVNEKTGLKKCHRCKKEKLFSEFQSDNSRNDGKCPTCRECNKQRNRDYRKRTGHKGKAIPPHMRRHYHYMSKYGLTEGDKDTIFRLQGSKCAICKTSEAKLWMLDHCHKSGAVRGVVCPRCNSLIGLAHDSQEMLLRAVHYLECARMGCNVATAVIETLTQNSELTAVDEWSDPALQSLLFDNQEAEVTTV